MTKAVNLYTDIQESTKLDLVEAVEDGEKKCFIEGIFMQANRENKNGRVYGKDTLMRAVDEYIVSKVEQGNAVGELDHPAGPNINLDRVSHKITELYWEGDDVIGKAQVLDTPMGMIVKQLLEGGVQLGVSSRGMGSVKTVEGKNYVSGDFVLNAVDVVANPSAPDAQVSYIMESAGYSPVDIVTENGNQLYVYNTDTGLYETYEALVARKLDESEKTKLQTAALDVLFASFRK